MYHINDKAVVANKFFEDWDLLPDHNRHYTTTTAKQPTTISLEKWLKLPKYAIMFLGISRTIGQ